MKQLNKTPILLLCILIVCPSINCWKPIVGTTNLDNHYPALETSISYHGKIKAPTSTLIHHGPDSSSFHQQHVLHHTPNVVIQATDPLLASHHHSSGLTPAADPCGNYKVGFIQDLYFQYIQYKHEIPEMKEFTLCMWTKFTNHSNDHPLFSYAVDGTPRAIYAWIANTNRSSYYSLSVSGHTFFRLNYPIRLNRWYHQCYSWNGKTGEWQLWVNAERVGRGFHNRLVGHVIPSGGIAISGQEQRQPGGGFLEGHEAPKGSGGMLGELTMVQLYKIALTAGKAHRNHKHHHAHKFLHEGVPTTPETPSSTAAPAPTPQQNLFLTGGQLNPMLQLNYAGGQPQEDQGQLLNGQLFNQLLASATNNGDSNRIQLVHPQLVNSGNVQFISDTSDNGGHIFKRDNSQTEGTKVKREVTPDNKHTKRGLFLVGDAIYEDGAMDGLAGLTHGTMNLPEILSGLATFDHNQPIIDEQQKSEDREPAEAEVKAIMNMCTGCDEEPFEKALVFGWRTVAKKLYSGAFYTPASPECKAF
ncbi:uncharacterized protein LOC123291563 [Chrysoperla carnea]|uniref:uncharacterized protein LOC123291563 n=1 Tax=Chrysoperla carnea TaxID=189513 RepID=UPI001D05FE5B|nr:uncharacterized protein LOC123291563 [Chrysoperla carnea]